MAADLGYFYEQGTKKVFLKHKCNFRLDVMYYKSLLIPMIHSQEHTQANAMGLKDQHKREE